MKGRIVVVILLVAVAAFAGQWVNRARSPQVVKQEETRQTFRLEPGARIEVRAVNGSVEVTTGETDTVEVHIVRTAESADDLEYGRVTVEGSSSYLSVQGESSSGRSLWHWLQGGGSVRQDVTLTVPRRVELLASHINGQVRIGEIDGSVEVTHINGRVEVAQSAGRAEVGHVNGNVKFGFSPSGEQGLDVSHVNGNIEIRLKQLVNADIEVERQNGSLSLNVPNVTMQERESRSNTRARLGEGGTPFQISHVNGNVRFESDAPAAASATNTAAVIHVPVATDGDNEPMAPPLPPAPLPR
ncbi:MAG: hypothetical protein QOJ70_2391 [Acidobacteriota bacterium]|jgi:hypothetical protein|nr:hypothetical protein [Acidobacteriota bacterium]